MKVVRWVIWGTAVRRSSVCVEQLRCDFVWCHCCCEYLRDLEQRSMPGKILVIYNSFFGSLFNVGFSVISRLVIQAHPSMWYSLSLKLSAGAHVSKIAYHPHSCVTLKKTNGDYSPTSTGWALTEAVFFWSCGVALVWRSILLPCYVYLVSSSRSVLRRMGRL